MVMLLNLKYYNTAMENGQFKTALPAKLTPYQQEQMAKIESGKLDLAAAWLNRNLTCSHCKRCTLKCEVLSDPNLDIGEINRVYLRLMALPEEDRLAATIEEVQARPELYHALRRCCFCGYCTSTCRSHLFSPEVMRNWRELFSLAGFMPPADSRTVMVDNEWDIFSAYRAIYGIEYPEFQQLSEVAKKGKGIIDTVLFPGCALVSYTPQLVRAVGQWLNERGFAWALSTNCCGSPLMSAGMFDRAEGLRLRIVEQLKAAGVKRFITVCPGCGEEFAENMPADIDIIPLPELLFDTTCDANTAEEAGFFPLGRVSGQPEALTDGAAEGGVESVAESVTERATESVAAPSIASYAVFDSCHDRRDNRHGKAIRQLLAKYLPEAQRKEIDHRKKNSLCCGAGGAVAGYDDDITARRVAQVLDEGRATGADTLVTMCPTCAYTIGQANLGQPVLGRSAAEGMPSHHYLELLFGIPIDWASIFANLEGMWSGEYGPWLTETFFS